MAAPKMVVKLDKDAFKRYRAHMKQVEEILVTLEGSCADLNTELACAQEDLSCAITIEEVKPT